MSSQAMRTRNRQNEGGNMERTMEVREGGWWGGEDATETIFSAGLKICLRPVLREVGGYSE